MKKAFAFDSLSDLDLQIKISPLHERENLGEWRGRGEKEINNKKKSQQWLKTMSQLKTIFITSLTENWSAQEAKKSSNFSLNLPMFLIWFNSLIFK